MITKIITCSGIRTNQSYHNKWYQQVVNDSGLQVMQRDNGTFISQDKYVADILKKFDFVTMKTASTPIKTHKALLKDEEAKDVDVHLYRSMIRSLMYLTASRPDIMFAVCACTRLLVTPKVSHLHVVKRIFRYLKGQPKLGFLYLRDSPFDLEDFLIVIMLELALTGNTQQEQIAVDRKPVFHSKTKHIEIRHHFIKDSYEKRLIQVIKIHIDHNVTDLLTKAFDVSRIDGRTCNIKQKCVKSQILERGREYKIPQSGGPSEKVGDEAVHKEFSNRMERAATNV
ncbi:hypothetical protein Tco_1349564 [Tanacetum coccineum]